MAVRLTALWRWLGRRALLLCACLFLVSSASLRAAAKPIPNQVLVLHDSRGEYGWLGRLYAQLLANLLGHFSLDYRLAPVEQYRKDDYKDYRAMFYLGAVYDNALPAAFLRDTMATTRPVCWLRYNLAQLGPGTSHGAQFETKFGFRFEYNDPNGYPRIAYKGETFLKDQGDPELGRVTILNSNRADVLAWALPETGALRLPYLVQSSNFWYVADIPFSYISEEDRYLIFTDALHDILQIAHPESHRALVRLEDISPDYDLEALRLTVDYLHSEGVPFAVAVIPVYTDPLGVFNEGIPERLEMTQAPAFLEALKDIVRKGGQLIMHGTTHQYEGLLNPYNGVSGDDYEFFRVRLDTHGNTVEHTPVPLDSVAWVSNRLQSGLQQFRRAGLSPVAFEPPHYAASALDYRVFATNFPLTIHRVLYFDEAGHWTGQFFPYEIARDVYGQRIAPENLGNVDPIGWEGYGMRLPEDLIRAARKNRVLRDHWASFFYHPYLDLDYLIELVTGLKALGYTFAPLSTSAPPTVVSDPRSQAAALGSNVTFNVSAEGDAPVRYQWQFNGTNLARATNTNLTLTNLQPAQAGTYTVVVANQAGSTTSLPAALQLLGPALSPPRWDRGKLSLSFPSRTGITYLVEYKRDLAEPVWSPLTSVTGNGAVLTLTDTNTARPRGFYRVRIP